MKVLSIYWGICSSASIYVDGEVLAAVNEERFTRKKNDDVFPQNAIQFCLQKANISADELDSAVVASNQQDYFHQLTRPATWSIEDYLNEQRKFWKPTLLENKKLVYEEVLKEKVDVNQYPVEFWKNSTNSKVDFGTARVKILSEFLNIPIEKVTTSEHHKTHAYYSYYASPFRNEDVLAFTVDAHGDGKNATIGTFDKTGKYSELFSTNNCYIARVYRYMTLLLGMKPNEHEFKVMGLAPYGKEKYSQKAYNVFKDTLYVDGLDFKWNVKPEDSYFWFKEKLDGIRFDSIAWGLQKWVEELLIDWVVNAINKFKTNKIVLAGGVAMNIKAMGKIAELNEVDKIFVGGSAADESLSISAGLVQAEKLSVESKVEWNSNNLYPIKSLYLGPQSTKEQEKLALEALNEDYFISEDTTPEKVAELLVDGKVIARCAGRMEFGQRALGNRSILADPHDLKVKEKINAMIKNRDFWMPFAPIILDRFADEYLINPKKLTSPYMTLGFETTETGYDAMIAACHPADRSARPQILSRNLNSQVFDIIDEFSRITGRGSVLNTSFNLHGFPIVNIPEEALYVFKNSGLDGLVLNHYLILKK